MASLPPLRTRRTISLSAVFGLLALFALFAPFWFFLAALADVSRGIRGWRFVRLTSFFAHALAIETGGIVANAALWVRAGFGTRIGSPKSRAAHSRLQYWYAKTFMEAADTCLAIRTEITGLELAEGGNAVMIGRHRSLPDALLPTLVCGHFGLEAKYVLAGGLQWGPNLDITGNRSDQVFVDRSRQSGNDDLADIAALASRIDTNSMGVIFPEGTFFSPARQAKALARIAESNPSELDQSSKLIHLLPPRPGGVAAMLDAAPDADVIFLGHVGLESLSTIADITKAVPAKEPVRVKLWRFPRHEVPTDSKQQREWILDQWLEVDQWIEAQQR